MLLKQLTTLRRQTPDNKIGGRMLREKARFYELQIMKAIKYRVSQKAGEYGAKIAPNEMNFYIFFTNSDL